MSAAGVSNVIPVTRNLASALQYLRLEDKPRVFWIDAICVNQEDLQERSHQVQRMANIYKNAISVVVWLGPECSQSGLAMKLLKGLSLMREVNWKDYTWKAISNDTTRQWWDDTTLDPPFEDHECLAILALLNRSWFERLWIWQEIQLADATTAIVQCGNDTILWLHFKAGAFALFRKPKPPGRLFFRLRDKAQQVFRLGRNTFPQQLYELASQTSNANCSDDRDRIYSFLSIASDYHGQLKIVIDYTKSTGQVYQDAALAILCHSQNSDILTHCQVPDTERNMPSWVPD